MTEQSSEGLHIDSDWKEEARQEKERLAETEAAGQPKTMPEVSFGELVNLVVMQAAMALGGFTGPKGESIPPDLTSARHYVDLLGLLEEKTAGNLTAEEKRVLDGVLYELRMQFVQTAGSPAGSCGPGSQPVVPPAGSRDRTPPADEPKIQTP